MSKARDDWKVLPHGPIEKLSENLWRVQGTLRGMSLKRTMTIARRDNGKLIVHSPIALEAQAMTEIEAWGSPSFLLVPNHYHRLDAPAYKQRYPTVRVLTPEGSRKKVEEAFAVEGSYDDFHDDATVWLDPLSGVDDKEGAMWVRSRDGVSLVLNDVVFNMDKKSDLLGWFFTTLFGSAPGPRISRLTKLAMIKDRQALRADLERFASTPDLVRLIVSHEKVASGPEAAAALRTAATYL